MAEEYVSFEEAQNVTSKSEDELKEFVREKGLRQFRDGGVTKFRREEFFKAAGLEDPGAFSPPDDTGEGDDFLMFADEEEEAASSGQADTVSDTLDLEEEADTGESGSSTDLASMDTVDIQEEKSAVTDEFDFGEEDIFADESTTDIGESDDETGTGFESDADEIGVLEDDDSASTSATVEASPVLGDELLEAEGETGSSDSFETAEVSLGEAAAAAEVEEGDEEEAPKAKKRRARPTRRPRAMMASAGAAQGSPIWGILCIVATLVCVVSALIIVDQLIGKQWHDGTYVGGIPTVQSILDKMRQTMLDIAQGG